MPREWFAAGKGCGARLWPASRCLMPPAPPAPPPLRPPPPAPAPRWPAAQAREFLGVLEAGGPAALEAHAPAPLQWARVRELAGPGAVGLPIGYRPPPAIGRQLAASRLELQRGGGGGERAGAAPAAPGAGGSAA
jgi:hypothetical protein